MEEEVDVAEKVEVEGDDEVEEVVEVEVEVEWKVRSGVARRESAADALPQMAHREVLIESRRKSEAALTNTNRL